MANITQAALSEYLQSLLELDRFRDYCPNGLQVAGRLQIAFILTGVTASQALLDAAIAADADTILVHHGYFWQGESACIVGNKRRRLASLLVNNINLFAYHLPLDGHAEYGNNVQLAKRLELEIDGRLATKNDPSILFHGRLRQPINGEDFATLIAQRLARKPLHIPGQASIIKRIAWCTGAAQDYIDYAIDAQVDAYLTGEVSERTVHTAREAGIHFYAAGHHATERYGIKALGEHLALKFGLQHRFVDIDNPV